MATEESTPDKIPKKSPGLFCFVLFCFVVSLLHFFSLLTLVHKRPKKEDEVVDDDPGIIIDYNDDRQIHQVLQLPSIASINPTLQPGVNAAQSKSNLVHWMDDLVTLYAKGDHCLVHTCSGVQQCGMYQQLGQEEQQAVQSRLSGLRQLTVECHNQGISAGRYFVICPADKGKLTIWNMEVGPFLDL